MSEVKEDLKVTEVSEEETQNLEENKTEEILTKEIEEENVETKLASNTKEQDQISPEENLEEKELKTKESTTEKIVKEKNNYNKKLIIALIIATFILLLFFSTIFAIANLNNNKIISGVSIKGIDVSGLTKEEAFEKISNITSKKLTTPFNLVHNDLVTTIIPEQLGANFDIETSIDTAYKIGREDNIFKNNFKILSSYIFKLNVSPSFSYNEETINTLITEIGANLPDRLIEPSYYIDGSNLVITKGIDGIVIEPEALKLKVITNINDFTNTNENIEIPVTAGTAKTIDLDSIYTKIHTEAKDATYTKDPFTVVPHVNGVDFGISMEEAKALLLEDKESYIIPLKITTPKVTINNIGSEAFPDLLATYSTNFSVRNVSRTTNIKLASAKINGTVLMPGDTFSYNTTVGKRTAAAGFKSAAVYAGGEVTTGIGGGICQVSSTLYNSVLLSNLEIVERYNHGFNPGYVPAGRDATVSWGGPDFKFKNSRKYPIKIVSSVSGGTITTKIFGTKEENEYEVEVQSYITGYIQYKTINKNDATLNVGQTKVIESGSNGCKAVCYRILKQNGNVISKKLLSSDTYNPHNRIVAVGTKTVAPVEKPVQKPTQTPTEKPEEKPEEKPTENPTEKPENKPTETPVDSQKPVENNKPTQVLNY